MGIFDSYQAPQPPMISADPLDVIAAHIATAQQAQGQADATHATNAGYVDQENYPGASPAFYGNMVQNPATSPLQRAMIGASVLPFAAAGAAIRAPIDAVAGFGGLAQQAHDEGPFATPADRGMAPGQAVQDNDPRLGGGYSDDTLGKVIGLASSVGMAGAPFERPAGSLGIFGGRAAATADLGQLDEAKALTSLRGTTGFEDTNKDSILKDTGWFRGLDGQWRNEIDDSGATLSPDLIGKFTVGDAFNHPDLYAAYPHLADISFLPGNFGKSKMGYWSPSQNTIGLNAVNQDQAGMRETMLHELQHAIQYHEGFSGGSNPGDLAGGFDAYHRTSGEVEARATAYRSDMSADQRRNLGVWNETALPKASEQFLTPRRVLEPASELSARNPNWRVPLAYDP